MKASSLLCINTNISGVLLEQTCRTHLVWFLGFTHELLTSIKYLKHVLNSHIHFQVLPAIGLQSVAKESIVIWSREQVAVGQVKDLFAGIIRVHILTVIQASKVLMW